jgi:hypothetical protein
MKIARWWTQEKRIKCDIFKNKLGAELCQAKKKIGLPKPVLERQ